jgi:hypothetical protein
VSDQVRQDPLTPHPERLSRRNPNYERIIAAHSAAIALGQAGYIDPVTGLFAITAETHVKRGTCCNRGCRHCPFLGADVHAGEEA